MLYFTSDTHFNDTKIIKQYGRNFETVDSMNAALIANWNTVIFPTDEVIFLGDLMLGGNGLNANNILSQLNGIKYLIRGNHDTYLNDRLFDKSRFQWVKNIYELHYAGMKFVLCHYPLFEWDGFFNGACHLYGHVHNQFTNNKQINRFKSMPKNAVNVCIDATGFYPVSIDSIIEHFSHGTPLFLCQEKTVSFKSETVEINYCYHLTNVNNMPSILELGLLSRDMLKEMKINYVDDSPLDLTSLRYKLGMNAYVPFHLLPHNPYDLYIFQKNNDDGSSKFCYIVIEDTMAELLNAKIQIEYPNYKPNLELVDFSFCREKINKIRQHTNYDNRLDKFFALSECLIKDSVDPSCFAFIIVGSDENHRDIKDFLSLCNLDIPVYIRPGYFKNWLEKPIFYYKSIIERQKRKSRGDNSLDDL